VGDDGARVFHEPLSACRALDLCGACSYCADQPITVCARQPITTLSVPSGPCQFSASATLLGRVRFRLLEHLLQGGVNRCLARDPCPLVTDPALVVDYVERRRGGEVPLRGDRSRACVTRVNK